MKNNKKGFTLTELLAVIVIMGIILTLAVPSVLFINNKIKEDMYDKKVELIEKTAQLYGQDRLDTIDEEKTIYIKELKETGYADTDNDEGDVIDPRNNRSMNCDEVTIKIKETASGKRVSAELEIIDKDNPKYDIMNPICE